MGRWWHLCHSETESKSGIVCWTNTVHSWSLSCWFQYFSNTTPASSCSWADKESQVSWEKYLSSGIFLHRLDSNHLSLIICLDLQCIRTGKRLNYMKLPQQHPGLKPPILIIHIYNWHLHNSLHNWQESRTGMEVTRQLALCKRHWPQQARRKSRALSIMAWCWNEFQSTCWHSNCWALLNLNKAYTAIL